MTAHLALPRTLGLAVVAVAACSRVAEPEAGRADAGLEPAATASAVAASPAGDPAAPDPYRVLGVARTATQEEVSAAFRKRATELHPDRHPGDPLAKRRFVELNQAYRLLNDVGRRAEWDQKHPPR